LEKIMTVFLAMRSLAFSIVDASADECLC
jgi:hypothetical protein